MLLHYGVASFLLFFQNLLCKVHKKCLKPLEYKVKVIIRKNIFDQRCYKCYICYNFFKTFLYKKFTKMENPYKSTLFTGLGFLVCELT